MKSLLLSIRELRARRYWLKHCCRDGWMRTVGFGPPVFDSDCTNCVNALEMTREKFKLPNFTP